MNAVLDLVFGTDYDVPRLREAITLLAAASYQKLGVGWNVERVKEAMKA